MARGHGSRLPNRARSGSKADFTGQATRVLAALGAAPLIRSLYGRQERDRVDGSHVESHHGMRPHFVSAVVADLDLCDPALPCLVPAQATVTAGSSGHAAPASSDATYSASAVTGTRRRRLWRHSMPDSDSEQHRPDGGLGPTRMGAANPVGRLTTARRTARPLRPLLRGSAASIPCSRCDSHRRPALSAFPPGWLLALTWRAPAPRH